MAVTEIRVKLIGDLNVQIKGPGKLRLSFLPKLFWLLRNEFAETTNLIHFYSVHNSDILAELISQNEATAPLNKDVQTYYQKPRS